MVILPNTSFLCVSLIAERIREILGIEMLSLHSSLL